MNTLAVNHAGYNVEHLTAGAGWQPVTPEPFATRTEADDHFVTMDRSCGEYRVYEALS